MPEVKVFKEPEFRDDVTVQLIRSAARDSDVVWSARVSTAGETSVSAVDQDPAEAKGLINYLLKNRHGTPFEHNSMTFMISAPIFVFREFHRHRVGWSYNEESARYRELDPIFYLPSRERKLIQVGKTGHYSFEDGSTEQYDTVRTATIRSCTEAYGAYQEMLSAGVAREVARAVLPVATFSTMYATCNARSLMSFLSLRTKNEDSAFPSYPQREIEMVAEKMEAEWAKLMPLTHAAFESAGRVSP